MPQPCRSRSPGRCSPSSVAPTTGRLRVRRRRCSPPATAHGRSRSTCRRDRGMEGRPRRHVGPQLPGEQRAVRAGGRRSLDVHVRRHVAPGRRRAGRPAGGCDRGRSPVGRHLAARRPHPRAVLLRDGRPLRERRPDERHRRDPGRPVGQRLRPDRQGLLPRRRHRRAGVAARLHRGSRHDRDLADAGVQEPSRAGLRHATSAPATTATGSPTSPRSIRTSAPTTTCARSSTRPTPAASRSSSTSSPTTPPT